MTAKKNDYDGYNVFVGDLDNLWYYSNKDPDDVPKKLKKGQVYAVSNHLLNSPWPKLVTGKDLVEKSKATSWEPYMAILENGTKPPDDKITDTGFGDINIEKPLSSIYVDSFGLGKTKYGTRTSTVVLIDDKNNVTFVDKNLEPSGE
eukprot:CAMPEP_0168538112 /NCGR_PEP_ID=MMETSP0405-20121227/20867_1 /TAXON_ID=498012 /ORGANISM="Trichosphaerium sp, Strain Am-I-7 wt" /LENGTH=146 /DNA_ID=CAMNT_0008567079 /DNA_START=183 /DNA_END=620 /DNA_ORIENTATION=+